MGILPHRIIKTGDVYILKSSLFLLRKTSCIDEKDIVVKFYSFSCRYYLLKINSAYCDFAFRTPKNEICTKNIFIGHFSKKMDENG